MFWKKKINLDSEEYLDLRKQILDLQLDVEQMQMRYKKKIKKPDDEEETPAPFDDGFNDLRKINKGKSPDYFNG